MSMQKFRWSRVYESSEEELLELFKARGLDHKHIAAEATSDPKTLSYGKAISIWCAEGSLMVSDEQTNISLQPGDAVRVDATANYTLTPGISGYICYTTTQ